MKSQSDEKETLSRRDFAKSAAALAAIPFVASLADAQQRRRRKAPRTQAPAPRRPEVAPLRATRDRNAHDTPPPLEIINGSFIVDTDDPIADGDIVTMGGTTKHHIRPHAGKIRIFPAHIKIVDGSGEMLYRLDTKSNVNPHPAEAFKITALLKDGTTVIAGSSPVVGNMQTFVIDTNNGRLLALPMAGDKPVGNKRNARRRLKRISDGTEPEDALIQRLTITSTDGVLYNLFPPTDLSSKGDELRIMIWLEEK